MATGHSPLVKEAILLNKLSLTLLVALATVFVCFCFLTNLVLSKDFNYTRPLPVQASE
jgi:hypothetical protein